MSEKSIKLTLNETDGTVEMDVKGLNPIEVVKMCNGMIATALNKIVPAEKPIIQKPSTKNVIDINSNIN